MIARLWWPLLSWCMANRWAVDAAVLIAAALIATLENGPRLTLAAFSQMHWVTIFLSVALVWYAAGRPGAGLGGLLAIAMAALTASSLMNVGATALTVLIALLAALQVPHLIELRGVRHRDEALRASARGLGILMPGFALGAPALFLTGGWTLVLAGALGTAAAMVLPLSWCRLAAEPAAVLPTAQPPRQAHLVVARGMQMTVLALVCLGTIDIALHLRAASPPIWQLLLPIALVALWHAVTGSVALALVATAAATGWLGYAFLGRTPWDFSTLLTGLALAQPLPLVLWHARRTQRRWPALLLIGVGVLPALAFGDTIAIGGAALAACLAVVLCAPRPLPALPTTSGLPDADAVLTRARRACQRLTPYWRHYGTAKLRYDPVYRQLAEHTLLWGRVLDAGCGPGLVAALASARGEPAYCGIDLDEGKLEAAAELLAMLSQPLAGDWRLMRAKLPLPHIPPTRFDTVLLIDVLHYWPEPEQEALLRQLHAMLDRGGRLILRDGISDAAGDTGVVGFSERLTTFFGLNPGGSGLHFLSEDAMHDLLKRCGFAVQSVEASGGANRLWRCTAVVSDTTAVDTPTKDVPTAQ